MTLVDLIVMTLELVLTCKAIGAAVLAVDSGTREFWIPELAQCLVLHAMPEGVSSKYPVFRKVIISGSIDVNRSRTTTSPSPSSYPLRLYALGNDIFPALSNYRYSPLNTPLPKESISLALERGFLFLFPCVSAFVPFARFHVPI